MTLRTSFSVTYGCTNTFEHDAHVGHPDWHVLTLDCQRDKNTVGIESLQFKLSIGSARVWQGLPL